MTRVAFDVYGTPGPQGSKRFVGRAKSGRGIMVESSAKVKPWREAVKHAAREAMAQAGIATIDAPIRVRMVFTVAKPASAPKTRRTWPMRKPDGSKLQRSTEDAISDAGLWRDDARVVEWSGAKVFPMEHPEALASPGVRVVIEVVG